MKTSRLLATAALALVFAASPALAAVSDAPVGPNGQSLGSLAEAAVCPYIAALHKAEPGSLEALIIKIGTTQSNDILTLRSGANLLGRYQASEAALQVCVVPDSNIGNNNYGGDTPPDGTNNPPQQHTSSAALEVWKPGSCEIKSSDMAPVTANIRSSEDFVRNRCMQEALIRKELLDNVQPLMSDPGVQAILCKKVIGKYKIEHNQTSAALGQTLEGGVFVTPSGLLYAAHVFGVDGLKQAIEVFRNGGVPAVSQATYEIVPNPDDPEGLAKKTQVVNAAGDAVTYPAGSIMTDGSDTPWTSMVGAANYFAVQGVDDPDCSKTVKPGAIPVYGEPPPPAYVPPKYGTPPIETTDYPFDKPGEIPTLLPPKKIMKQVVHEIRQNAGVRDQDLAENPSYNEIMLAMTKEKFFNPNYFVNMATDLSAIRQEQTMVNAYINIQMKDIFDMQERINSLLAARASLKMNEETDRDSLTHLQPQ